MSRIKGKDTRPELLIRRFLFRRGYRYRVNYKLPGKPDIVFPRDGLVVFIHGCFWHMHGCKNSVIPQKNRDFWLRKLTRNVERDKEVKDRLYREGWEVLTVWECEIENDLHTAAQSIIDTLSRRRK